MHSLVSGITTHMQYLGVLWQMFISTCYVPYIFWIPKDSEMGTQSQGTVVYQIIKTKGIWHALPESSREIRVRSGNSPWQTSRRRREQESRSGRGDNARTIEGRGHRGRHTCVAQGSLVHILSFPMAKPWALISLLKNLLMVPSVLV